MKKDYDDMYWVTIKSNIKKMNESDKQSIILYFLVNFRQKEDELSIKWNEKRFNMFYWLELPIKSRITTVHVYFNSLELVSDVAKVIFVSSWDW